MNLQQHKQLRWFWERWEKFDWETLEWEWDDPDTLSSIVFSNVEWTNEERKELEMILESLNDEVKTRQQRKNDDAEDQ